MALSRSAKEALASDYQDGLAAAPHAFVVGFDGISVAQVDDLRRRIRENGGHYRVVKNRVALRVLDGTGLEELKEHFEGMTAVAYHSEDAVGLAKALNDFAKEHPVLTFKAGLVNGQTVSGDDVKKIAGLPSREELVAKLLFLLQSPLSRLVRGLAAIPRELVVVVDQVRQQKEASG